MSGRTSKLNPKRSRISTIHIPLLTLGVLLFVFAIQADSSATLRTRAPDLLAGAAVGMSAGVEPNQYNTLAQQLHTKETTLAAREARLADIEASVRSETGINSPNLLSLLSLLLSLILFALVGVNFYFDRRRYPNNTSTIVLAGER